MLLMFGFRHGERVDIVAAAGEQADHPRQHAGLVVDETAQCMRSDFLRRRRGGIVRGWCSLGHFSYSLSMIDENCLNIRLVERYRGFVTELSYPPADDNGFRETPPI